MAQAKSKQNVGGSGPDLGSSNSGLILAVLAVIVIGLGGLAFVIAGGGDDEAGESTATDGAETSAVEVIGDALAPMPEGVSIGDATNDPVVGSVAPTLIGTSFDGSDVTIEADGQAKAVYFLAHWCPHCQEEVPVVQELLDAGSTPDGMTVYAVSTAVSSGQGNFPPSAWLADEGFSGVTMRDDDVSSAFAGFGGQSFPYVVYLDANNQVVARSAGNLDAAATLELWELAAG